ncbi:MAG: DUF362 domain-containing protein [Chitinispirillaceae bacterium]
MKSKVSIVHNPRVDRGLAHALEHLGSLSELFNDKHVAIKPNETWASPGDLTACTQADTVKALIRLVKRYRPFKITVTGGSGDGETDQIFGYLGIDKVIFEERVEFFDHNRGPFEKIHLDYGPAHEVIINPHIFSFDTIVSLAQHKVHKRADVTLTMKNTAMSFPAADYYGHPRWKYEHAREVFFGDLHGFITGMCQRFPFQLGIINGHPAMTGTGPIGGKAFESQLVIAGRDFVAVDAVGAYLLGRKNVSHIEQADYLGLGQSDLNNIEIAGTPLERAADIFNARASERK